MSRGLAPGKYPVLELLQGTEIAPDAVFRMTSSIASFSLAAGRLLNAYGETQVQAPLKITVLGRPSGSAHPRFEPIGQTGTTYSPTSSTSMSVNQVAIALPRGPF